MAQLTRPEFNSFIESTLPDNSTREISAADLRTSFFNLADSIVSFNNNIYLNSLNFGTEDSRTTFAGNRSLARKGVNGFVSQDNSAYGFASLQLSFTGLRNTAIGSHSLSCASLGSDNVAVGVNSLGSTSTGSGNLGLGNFSLMGNKNGNFNIAIGHGAGYTVPSDGEFKFYLGVYPQASGDCDDLVDGIDGPPLLYGDLKSLQLAIGASGFRGSEKLAVSGDILPYESGGVFSLGSGDYRWDAHIQDLYVSGNIITGGEASFYSFNVTDGLSAADTIQDAETITISGVSGVNVDYSSNFFRVSAGGLSGVIDSQLLSLSGSAPAFNGVSGLIWNVSGWAANYADTVGISAGAYTHWRVQDQNSVGENITDPSTSENTVTFTGVSGNLTNYRSDTNTLEISAKPISGILNTIIDHSGDYLLNLIYNSGDHLRTYADDVETRSKSFTNEASGALRNAIADSGYLISGILQSQITTNDSRTSGIFNALSGVAPSIFGPSGLIYHVSGAAFEHANNIAAAAGSYTFWNITDGSNNKNIEHSDVLRFVGEDGVSAVYDSSASVFTISASDLSGVLINTSTINDSRASGLISFTSGVLDRFIKTTSGVFRSEISEITRINTGTIDSRIDDAIQNDVYNVYDPYIENNIEGPNGLSGILNNKIIANSGYIEDLNHFFDNRASGYINALSGVNHYDFYALNGIVHKVSGVVQRYVDSEIDQFTTDLTGGNTGSWKIGDQTLSSTRSISFNKKLNIIGKDGLTTLVGGDTSPFSLTVDAAPISGYLEGVALEITGVQGCFQTKLNNVSGWAFGTVEDYAYRSGVLVSGWANSSFLYYDNRASGLSDHLSGILRAGISDSGSFFDNRASGLIDSVSGNIQYQLASLSGLGTSYLGEPDGFIWNVSGWNKSYTDQEVQALSLASDAYLHWKISDGTTVRQIRSLEETQFVGISGIETNTKTTGASGLFISARPLEERASGLIEHASGVLHGIIGQSGTNILSYVNGDFFNNTVKTEIVRYADQQDNIFDGRASGLINFVSGVLDRHIDITSGNLDSYIDTVSGWANLSFSHYDNRASGYILATSGSLSNSAGSGLVRLSGGEFNTAGSGNFERVFLNRSHHANGQLVADSGKYHDIVNSSGFLVVPTANTFDEIRNQIDPAANSGAIAFAGGHVRVSNGVSWHRPPVIEGFMIEDLDPPTDYLNPTSGKILTRDENFLASDIHWITNRDHTFAASGGYFLMAMLVNNEYRPVWSTCSGCPSCE